MGLIPKPGQFSTSEPNLVRRSSPSSTLKRNKEDNLPYLVLQGFCFAFFWTN
ncbi:hypothetical protein Scep_026031 [Stephania cephalantha]|uniref:Uncharacterized protein n=1 Tax=Stephania cephalantha TaxID=152367 RepID=A0AAP0EPL5_9MAGN